MDPGAATQLTTAAIPAVVSTTITVLYLLLKLITYITNATSRKTEKPEAEDIDSPTGHTQQSGGQRGQGVVKVLEQKQRHSYKRGDGAGWTPAPRTLFLRTEREDICLPPQPDGERSYELPSLQRDDASLCHRRNTCTASCHGQRPPSPRHDSCRICTTSQGLTDPRDAQPQRNPAISREEQTFTEGTTTGHNSSGVQRFREASTTTDAGPVKQTIEAEVQTDTDAFVVSKDTLVAYTIAVIQQTNDYHFGQMSIVYQTAHNKTALETPSRAEELAKDHFNIALLTDKKLEVPQTDDQDNTSSTTVDPTPTTSTQETIPKSVDSGSKHPNTKPPTGAVHPTSRSESRLCEGIPAGDESDDSWGYLSSHARPETQSPDLEEELLPILTLRAWQAPNRGTFRGRSRGGGQRQCNHRQHSRTIPVRDGYDHPPRPWESRPYGRRTRSQRALQERAYRKWARRNQVQ